MSRLPESSSRLAAALNRIGFILTLMDVLKAMWRLYFAIFGLIAGAGTVGTHALGWASGIMGSLVWGIAIGVLVVILVALISMALRKYPQLTAKYTAGEDLVFSKQGVGLVVENVGEVIAYDISIDPIQIGPRTISFSGPEVPTLDTQCRCFFRIDTSGPPVMDVQGDYIAALIRNWKTETDNETDPKGCIRYRATPSGLKKRAVFEIGIDVLARNGIVVRMK